MRLRPAQKVVASYVIQDDGPAFDVVRPAGWIPWALDVVHDALDWLRR